jgi:hypothetical protein
VPLKPLVKRNTCERGVSPSATGALKAAIHIHCDVGDYDYAVELALRADDVDTAKLVVEKVEDDEDEDGDGGGGGGGLGGHGGLGGGGNGGAVHVEFIQSTHSLKAPGFNP